MFVTAIVVLGAFVGSYLGVLADRIVVLDDGKVAGVGTHAELLKAITENNELFVNLTVTTLDTRLARILEPRAATPTLSTRSAIICW